MSRLRSAAAGGVQTDFECGLQDAHGAWRWFALSLQPLPESAGGRHWLCLGTDIHALRCRTEALESRMSVQADMLNISVDCLKCLAPDGTLRFMNRAGCRALGVPEDSPFGMPWLPLLPEDVRESGARALALAGNGVFARFPGRSELPGQKARHWDNMLTPVMDSAGRPTSILCVSREVTGEREALESLQESRERLAIALHAGRFGIWDYDIRHDALQCDEAWYRIMGREADPPIRSVAEFRPWIYPEDADRATEVDQTAAELIAGDRDYAIEFRIVRPDGGIRWVRSTACLLRDAAGAPARAVGFVVDITDARMSEQRLQESHEALRQAEKLARTGHWTWDIAADHAVWSEMLYEIFGLDASRPAPRLEELRNVLTPESYGNFLEVAGQCVTAGVPYCIDLEGVRTDGARCFVSARGEPVRDALGTIVKVRGTLSDITDRKDAENRIRALNERIQLAVEAGGVGIWEMDPVTRTFAWDEGMHVLYGLRSGQFGGGLEEWAGRIHPGDAPEILASWGKALAEDTVFKAEFRVVHPSGEVRFLRAQARILRGSGGGFVGAIGTNWDITAAREAGERLHAERQLLRQLIDHLPEVVFITDREDHVQVGNPALLLALGIPPDSGFSGERLHSFLPPETGDRLWRETVEVMESGVPLLNHVEEMVLPSGERQWVRTSRIPRRDAHGAVIGVICFFANITEERLVQEKIRQQADLLSAANSDLQSALAEAERQALRAQSSERAKAGFLAMMSHEIRTPMNGVIGMADLLSQTALDSSQADMLRVVQNSAESLLVIINDILDFSKIEAGKLRISPVGFHPGTLMAETHALLAPAAGKKSLELIVSADPALPALLKGDDGRIRQILINLAGNAVKFTERGSVTLEARRLGAEGSATLVRFAVRDTGVGIPPEVRERLFEPFAQADDSVSRRFGGTGLGLAICRQLVSLMGGEIGLRSGMGQGSEFWFTLPLQNLNDPAAPGTPAAEASPAAGRQLRLLVADDMAINQAVARGLLSKMGHLVDIAGSGEDALAKLAESAYDAVLMDCLMPGLDGYETTRRIRSGAISRVDPRVHIIALTASAMAEDREACFSAGMDDFVSKPIRRDDIRAALERVPFRK